MEFVRSLADFYKCPFHLRRWDEVSDSKVAFTGVGMHATARAWRRSECAVIRENRMKELSLKSQGKSGIRYHGHII